MRIIHNLIKMSGYRQEQPLSQRSRQSGVGDRNSEEAETQIYRGSGGLSLGRQVYLYRYEH